MRALEFARRATYPEASVAHLPPDLRSAYIETSGPTVRVASAVKECVVFARHNLAVDPQFLRMDLVSCRNVLIYFENDLRDTVLRTIHSRAGARRTHGARHLRRASVSIGCLHPDRLETAHLPARHDLVGPSQAPWGTGPSQPRRNSTLATPRNRVTITRCCANRSCGWWHRPR